MSDDEYIGARSISKVDILVGRKIRAARLESGVSQTFLAERLGITFQQVQKYEKGVNRIAAARLLQISRVLNKSVGWFLNEDVQQTAPQSDLDLEIWRTLASTDGRELLSTFTKIESPEVRRRVLALINSLADAGPEFSANVSAAEASSSDRKKQPK